MNLSSKYPHGKAPSHNASKEPQIEPTTSAQHRQGAERYGKQRGKGREVWRRVEESTREIADPRGGKPLALAGDNQTLEPAARLPNSTEIQQKHALNTHPSTTTMKHSAAAQQDHTHTDEGIVHIDFPEELFAILRSKSEQKTSVSLIGRIQGKHPGFKALTA